MSAGLPQAFSFSCPLDLAAIRHKLQALGTFRWTGHESEYHGAYIVGHPLVPDWPVKLRIYGDDAPDYLLEFDYFYWKLREGESPTQAIAFAKEQLLPALGASSVKQTVGVR